MNNGVNFVEDKMVMISADSIDRAKRSLMSNPDIDMLKERFEKLKESSDAFFATVATGNDDRVYCGVFPIEISPTEHNPGFKLNSSSLPMIFTIEDNIDDVAEFAQYTHKINKPLISFHTFHYNTFTESKEKWSALLDKLPDETGFEVIQTNILENSHSGNSLSNFAIQNGLIPHVGGNINKKDVAENVVARMFDTSFMNSETLNRTLKSAIAPVRFSMLLNIGTTHNVNALNEIYKNLQNMSRFSKMRNINWKHYLDTPYFNLHQHLLELKDVFEMTSDMVGAEQSIGDIGLSLWVSRNQVAGIKSIPGLPVKNDFDMEPVLSHIANDVKGAKITKSSTIYIPLGDKVDTILSSIEKLENSFCMLSNMPVTLPVSQDRQVKVNSADDLLKTFVQEKALMTHHKQQQFIAPQGML